MGTPTPLRARFGLDNQSNVIRNIGNESSISAASAGANALRINSNTLQISDGAAWNNVGGGSSALRIVTLTDAATVTPNADTTDVGILTSLSQTTIFANPTGAPTDGQLLQLRITSSTSRSISFGTAYQAASTLVLPTATTGSGLEDYIGFRWNALDSEWDFIGSTIGISLANTWRSGILAIGPNPKRSGSFILTTTGLNTGRQLIVQHATGGFYNDDLEMDAIAFNGIATSSTTAKIFWNCRSAVGGNKNFNFLQV